MTAPVAAAQVHAIAHQSGITAYDLGHASRPRPAYLGEAEKTGQRWTCAGVGRELGRALEEISGSRSSALAPTRHDPLLTILAPWPVARSQS